MDAIPLVLFWSLAACGLIARSPLVLLYLFFASGPFGAFAVIPPAAIGGVTLLPQEMCAVLLMVKVMMVPGAAPNALRAAFDPGRFLLLSLFLLVAVTSAFVLPRLFAGKVEVIPIRAMTRAVKVPLEPTTANFTQAAYLCVSYGVALSSIILLGRPGLARHIKNAILLGSAVLVATGFADMAAAGSKALSPFRTATYALLTNIEVQGGRRVVGLMPEASAFGGQCVADFCLLLFLRSSFPPGRLKAYAVPATLCGLLAMAALSTSSSAYVGLAVVFALAGLDWARSALWSKGRLKRQLVQDAVVAVVALTALLALIAFRPSVLAPAADMIDLMVFQKSKSQSFAERSYANQAGLDAFRATSGLGVGIGGARTSSLLAAYLSNTGAIGTALIGAFLLQTLLRRAASPAADTLRATKYTLIAIFVMMLLAATTPDFGVVAGVLYAWAARLGSLGSLGSERGVRTSPRQSQRTRNWRQRRVHSQPAQVQPAVRIE